MSRISQNILRIGADNSNLKKVMKDSSSLLDKSQGRWKQYGSVLTKELDKVNDELNKMLKSAKSMDDIKSIRKMANDAKSLRSELDQINNIGSKGGGGRAAGGGGGLMGMVAKMLPGLAPLLIGAQAYSASREFHSAQMPLIGLTGQGLNKGQIATGDKFGFDAISSARIASNLAQQTGGTGGLANIMAMSKGFGIDTGELTQAAGGFRRAGLSQESSVKVLADVIGTAVAANIDRSRTAEFIRVTASMTEELAGQGIEVDPAVIARMAGNLASASQFFQARPQAVQAGLGAVSNLLQNSSGQRFGFAAEAMQRAAGGNMKGSDLLYEMSLGLGEGGQLKPEERMQAIFDSLKDVTSGLSENAAALVGGQLLNISPALAKRFMSTTGQITSEEAKKFEEEIKEAKKSPEVNAIEVMTKTLSGRFNKLDSTTKNNLIKLGDRLAPTVNEIRDGITTLVDIASGIAGVFGINKEGKGLVTQSVEAYTNLLGGGTKNANKRIDRDIAMGVLKRDTASLSSENTMNIGNIIRSTKSPKELSNIERELQEKASAVNDEATQANTAALLDLVREMRAYLNRLVLSGGRATVLPGNVTPQGANE